jgi:hypothetical protein
MHIGEKLLNDIQEALGKRYSIYISQYEWKPFKEPLLMDRDGKINRKAFEERQNKAINIIENILDIHDKAVIVKFLGRLASMEPKIQQLQPWVRDHVVHAINTFILGAFILEKIKFPKFRGARFDYPFMWKLCGPTHDLGYPVEIAQNIREPFAHEVNDILESIGSPSPKVQLEPYPENLDILCENRDANQIIQKRLTEWGLGINIKDYYTWLKNKDKTDHGVVSALAQLKVIEAKYYQANPKRKNKNIRQKLYNFNQKNFDLDIVSASSALFIHNIDLDYKGFSNKISFKVAPLAFLLFLCDTFQEWDRYTENRPVYSGEQFDINCTKKSISLTVPEELKEKVFSTLNKRLSGLTIKVNGRAAVT